MTDTSILRGRPSQSRLLARILAAPNLAEQVQALPAAVLARVIDHVGLEDAGEIVAFATTSQLAQVFDEDLWSSERPGEDERFDADRFLVWLEVMLEAGDSFVARKLSELPEDLVTLAFHRQILVLNVEELLAEVQDMGEDGASTEKALSNCLSEELDDYQLISRQNEGWDSVLSAILALDRDHHGFLVRMLERCARMSAEYIEDNGGLYEVLCAEETLEADVAAEREDRRGEAGHVAPSAAASFLKLARGPAGTTPYTAHDPVTRAYLRGLEKTDRPAKFPSGPVEARAESNDFDLVRLLREAGVDDRAAAPPLLLVASNHPTDEPLLVQAMRRLSEEDAHLFSERSGEIAYLANILAAGCTFQQRRMRPVEALRAAIATASLGLELSSDRERKTHPVAAAVRVLRHYPADGLFRVAWSRLDGEVIRPAADTAAQWMSDAAARLHEEDARALLRAAARVRQAVLRETPHAAVPELESMSGVFEPAIVETLRGLMDECPWISAGFSQLFESDVGGGEGEYRFVSSASDLAKVRAFLKAKGRSSR